MGDDFKIVGAGNASWACARGSECEVVRLCGVGVCVGARGEVMSSGFYASLLSEASLCPYLKVLYTRAVLARPVCIVLVSV